MENTPNTLDELITLLEGVEQIIISFITMVILLPELVSVRQCRLLRPPHKM